MTRARTRWRRGEAFTYLGLAVAAAGVFALDPPAFAETYPAETTAKAFIRTFNSGDRSAYEGFLKARRWAFTDGDEFAIMRDQTGGYVPIRTKRVGRDEVEETVRSRLADDYWIMDLKLVEHGRSIERLAFRPVERPADVPAPRRVAPAAIGRLIDRRIAAMGDFSGVVLVAAGGRPVVLRAAGMADREQGVANTIDTRFGLASMGKMFTAVAVLQLVQAGRVELDAPIGTYLKDYPNAEFGRSVTVRELLTHTGGAGDFMSQLWADNLAHLRTPADYVALFGARAPEFPPGSRFSYANYGYVVLGRIIEAVSGQAYDQYLQDHIFGPADMARTGLHPVDPRFETAKSHVKDGFPPPPPALMSPLGREGTPAGGAFSTAPDLLAFAKALTGHRLLDAAHTEMLFTPEVNGGMGPTGLGFDTFGRGAVREVGHNGGGPGENGGFRILDDGGAVIVVLSNVAPTWRGDKLCAFIAARLHVGQHQ